MEEHARDPVAEAAARGPGRPALIVGDLVLAWSEPDIRVTAAAGCIAARTEPGDRAARVLGNTIGFAVAWSGVLRAGRPRRVSIRDRAGARLARFTVPGAEIVAELPGTPIGKIRKRDL